MTSGTRSRARGSATRRAVIQRDSHAEQKFQAAHRTRRADGTHPGSTAAQADTITSRHAGESGGTFTVGNTSRSARRISAFAETPCVATPSPACALAGLPRSHRRLHRPDGSTAANDYVYSGLRQLHHHHRNRYRHGRLASSTRQLRCEHEHPLTFDNECLSGTCFGSWAHARRRHANTVLASFFGVSTSLNGGSATNLFFNYAGSLTGSAPPNSRRRRRGEQRTACRRRPPRRFRARFHAPARHRPARFAKGTPPFSKEHAPVKGLSPPRVERRRGFFAFQVVVADPGRIRSLQHRGQPDVHYPSWDVLESSH